MYCEPVVVVVVKLQWAQGSGMSKNKVLALKISSLGWKLEVSHISLILRLTS